MVCNSKNPLKQDSQELASAVKVYKREKKLKNQEPLRISEQDKMVSTVKDEKVDDYKNEGCIAGAPCGGCACCLGICIMGSCGGACLPGANSSEAELSSKQDSQELASPVNVYKKLKKVKNQEPLRISEQDKMVSTVKDDPGCSDECYDKTATAMLLCYDEDKTDDEFETCVYLTMAGSDCYDSVEACVCLFVYYNTGEWVCNSKNLLKQDSQELASAVKVYKREKKLK